MELLGTLIATGLLATALCSTASAHQWVCEFCGKGVSASNQPQPGNSCSHNPSGRFHSWVMDNEDGKSHHWTCAFCGTCSNAVHMPHPSTSCSKNPAGRFHKWIMDN
ncbi:MAG: hypothetical protein IJS39_02355 [Synergistaceae bacterium]|nr:hypothetical protein [Synergistaceae bacterium]